MTSELIWQHLEAPGWEHVRVISDHPGWTVFDSIFVREDKGQVLRGGYTLVLDKHWRTLELRLMVETSPGTMDGIHLLTEGDGRWTDANEQHIVELDGCLDVDIQWTPLTNTLPINRLSLPPGKGEAIRIAYISLPDLLISPMDQKYERLDWNTVRYFSLGRPEGYVLYVDDQGYITEYPGRFARTFPQ